MESNHPSGGCPALPVLKTIEGLATKVPRCSDKRLRELPRAIVSRLCERFWEAAP
jgi:hypothetical protein